MLAVPLAGVFYNVKNGLSFTIISVMKTNTGVFVVFKTKRELKCQFSGITEILWRTFWRNKWQSVFDIVYFDIHKWGHSTAAGLFMPGLKYCPI